ncbi:MAG TPA: ABATE domain-containing protein, partial [Miltoncostaeaceae bacterium]|nr:ABATE domain-containing protein [Miltoncostaeaceae bacterium]
MEPVRPATRDLPDDLALPLLSGAPWWYWDGGRPALDLVNTLRERWRRRVETLCGPGDLHAWLVTAGLLAPEAPPATAAHVTAARDLREAIDLLVSAVTARRAAPPAAVATVDGWLRRVAGGPALVVAGGIPVLRAAAPAGEAGAALGAVARDAARMLGTPERERVRICASDTCSARFFDRSPAGRRRWCSMSACGNRAKARR